MVLTPTSIYFSIGHVEKKYNVLPENPNVCLKRISETKPATRTVHAGYNSRRRTSIPQIQSCSLERCNSMLDI